MSFVIGFISGMTTGEAVERRKERRRFHEAMERRGLTVVDRQGRPVPLDVVIDEAMRRHKKTGRNNLVAGVALAAIIVMTGGSAWAAVAILA
jgi:hypothetical protein